MDGASTAAEPAAMNGIQPNNPTKTAQSGFIFGSPVAFHSGRCLPLVYRNPARQVTLIGRKQHSRDAWRLAPATRARTARLEVLRVIMIASLPGRRRFPVPPSTPF